MSSWYYYSQENLRLMIVMNWRKRRTVHMLFKLTNGWHGDNCHNDKGHDGFICQYEQ